MSAERLLRHLDGVKRIGKAHQALCPCHDDHNPSLTVDVADDGTVLVHCHACDANGLDVCRKLGLEASILFADDGPAHVPASHHRLEDADRRHEYKDETGALLYTVAVFGSGKSKEVRPFLPSGKQGYGKRKILYALPEVLASSGLVYLVEGEKDADRLQALDLTATTSPMGAGKFGYCDSTALTDRDVVVLGDNDEAGRRHVQDVVKLLAATVQSVWVVTLPGLEEAGDVSDWLDAGHTKEELRALSVEAPVQPETQRFDPGGVVFDLAATPDALWGSGSEILAATGEPTLLYSNTGIGKTTVAQRVGLGAIGIGPAEVLGYPVKQIEGRVLYVAADRPSQAMRSLRRMVCSEDRATLDERWRWERRRSLRIIPERPEAIHEAAVEVGATLVILDSIKDLVAKVSSDEAGQAYNDAVQICVANGVEVIALHHPRKATSDGRIALSLDDVYGSTWISAGAGSVIALDGRAGEGIARLRQLKMPAEEVGPFDIDFDYDSGEVTTIGQRDLSGWFATVGTASTAEATRYMLGRTVATETEKRRIRRKLKRLVKDGYLTKTGDAGAMALWSWIGGTSDSSARTEVGQAGRTPTWTGSDTMAGNVDAATIPEVGHGVGQHQPPRSDTSSPSREGTVSAHAASLEGTARRQPIPVSDTELPDLY